MLGSDWVGSSSVEKGAGGSKVSMRQGCIVAAEACAVIVSSSFILVQPHGEYSI